MVLADLTGQLHILPLTLTLSPQAGRGNLLRGSLLVSESRSVEQEGSRRVYLLLPAGGEKVAAAG